MRERFAAAVTRLSGLHQAGVQAVLHVAAQDAVLDQHRALRRIAFVVEIERAATLAERAVVDNRHPRRGDALADPPGECARSLPVEVALETVSDRLVQQNT